MLFATHLLGQGADELSVVEEYFGPLPTKISSTFDLSRVKTLPGANAAYLFRYDAPEKFLEYRTLMESDDPPPPLISEDIVVHYGFKPTVRVVINGVPTEPYIAAAAPYVGRHHSTSYLAYKDGGVRMFLNGQPGEVRFPSYTNSLFHNRTGVYAIIVPDKDDKSGKLKRLIYNDREGPPCVEIHDLVVSNFGTVGYIATLPTDNKQHLLLNHKPGNPYNGIGQLTFSPDGQRYMHAAATKLNGREQLVIVVDGKEQPPIDSIRNGSLTFSPDSQHFAYAAKLDGKWRVIVDGTPQAAFDDIQGRFIDFANEGVRVAYIAQQDDKFHLVVDGKPGPAFDEVERRDNLFAPDGRTLAVVKQGTQWSVLCDGEPARPFDEIRHAFFNSDGTRLAYVGVNKIAEKKTVSRVVIDGRPDPEFDAVDRMTFSADGKRFAYVAISGEQQSIILDGQPALEGFDQIHTYRFSPDGKRLAARGARGGNEWVELHNEYKTQHAHDEFLAFSRLLPLGLHFSPDSKHLGYWALDANEQYVLVVDRQLSKPYDRVLPDGLEATENGAFHGFAVRDGELLLVTSGSIDKDPNSRHQILAKAAWDEGVRHEGNGDLLQAFAYFRKGAAFGNADCQYAVGRMFVLGQGIAKNEAQGLLWTRRSAEQGHLRGTANMGNIYKNGFGVPVDLNEAFKWYKQSAELGSPVGAHRMGEAYLYGTGVARDEKAALQWFLQAARQGNSDAMHMAGHTYHYADQFPRDYRQAMSWYQKAAEVGNTYSMNNIGNLARDGLGFRANQDVAKQWFRKAARLGSEGARDNLQKLLPAKRNSRGMYPWFIKAKNVGRSTTTGGPGHDPRISLEFNLDVPLPNREQPTSVSIPAYVFTTAELVELQKSTPKAGRVKLDRSVEQFRPLTQEQWTELKESLPDVAIPIAYPPYLVIGPQLSKMPAGTKLAIQDYLDSYYEREAQK
ncbi:MAG: SEL1-like repeat protein [Planctomycetales bacterium]|nr:SEL1-like repeat protein [Planctomycetales bacterium]